MKINRAKKKETRPRLMDLACGTVFEHIGDYYIKVFWKNAFRSRVNYDTECQHVVHLGTGEIVALARDCRVFPSGGEYVPSG